jgi:hypothetical protein
MVERNYYCGAVLLPGVVCIRVSRLMNTGETFLPPQAMERSQHVNAANGQERLVSGVHFKFDFVMAPVRDMIPTLPLTSLG